jgi:hypothetical protein
MKRIALSLSILFFSSIVMQAQNDGAKLPPVDKSPMDMCYFPDNYPVLKIRDKVTDAPVMRLIYGRPQKAGRIVFGELVEYGKIWRFGANEATEIEFYKQVKFGGKKIPKGRYTLYALVEQDKWTLIVNKDTDIWGSFKYDAKKDVARMEVPVTKTTEISESLSMIFDKTISGCNLIAAWDNVKVLIPFEF